MKLNKLLEIVTEWVIYLSVVIVPLLFMPQVSSVFSSPKLYVIRVITLIIILLWGIRGLLGKNVKIRFNKFFWFVLAYGVISLINTFVSVNIYSSLFGTYGRFTGIFTVVNLLFWAYIVFAEFKDRKKLKKLLWASIITAVIVALYGLMQYFDFFVNIFPWSQNPMERVFGTIGHSNHTAAYLGMNLMILIPFIVLQKKGPRKNILWICLAVIASTLILTASRGGVFAVLAALGLWLVCVLRSKKLTKKSIKYTVVGLIVASLLGVLFSGPISNIGVVERTVSTVSFMQQGNVPDRISWWYSSIEMIMDKPLLGHGLSTYKDSYNQYRRTDYRVPGDEQDFITPESAHNEYLNIAVTQGMIGFIAYAFMIVMLFVYARRFLNKTDNKEHKLIVFGLVTALTVYLVEVFISFGNITTLFIFFTFIGVLIAYTKEECDIQFKSSIIFKVVTLLLAGAIFVVGFMASLNQFLADYHLKQADSYKTRGNLELSIENYKKAIRLSDHTYKYHEAYADFLFGLGMSVDGDLQETILKDAIIIYDGAISVNDRRANAYLNKGLANSKLADLYKDDPDKQNKFIGEAHGSMLKALEVIQNNPFYTHKTAQSYEYYNNIPQALIYYNQTLEIRDPYKDTALKIKQLEALLSF